MILQARRHSGGWAKRAKDFCLKRKKTHTRLKKVVSVVPVKKSQHLSRPSSKIAIIRIQKFFRLTSQMGMKALYRQKLSPFISKAASKK